LRVSCLWAPDSILPLPWFLCCALDTPLQPQSVALIFHRLLVDLGDWFLQNTTYLCVCSPGHLFWWDLGAGGAGAWDGHCAHCECRCAGGGHPGDIPLLQHVSLVQGGLMWLHVCP